MLTSKGYKIKIAHVVMSLRYGGIQEIVRILARHMDRSLFQHLVFSYDASGEMGKHYEQAGALVEIAPDSEVISRAIQNKVDVVITYTVNGTNPEEHKHVYHAYRAKLPLLNFHACSFPCKSPPELFTSVIVPSKANANLLGWPNVQVIPLPVERFPIKADQRALRKELGIAENAVVIGRCSRLEPSKLIIETLRCMRLVEQKVRKPLHFILAGAESQWLPDGMKPGQYIEFLKEEAKRLAFRSPIDITGAISLERKWQILNCLDICLAPSLMEGFGFVFAEPLSVGVPVVTVDHMANRSTVGPGGLFVYPSKLTNTLELVGAIKGQYRLTYDEVLGDAELEALAELTTKLVNDKVMRRQLGKAGQVYVTKGKSPKEFAQRIAEIVLSVLKNGKG